MPVIEVSHLTKEYRLGALQGLKQQLINTGARLIGRKAPERPLFKALDDVSFSIEQGEVVGIIGHNGAGKSTLLKMLARISTPTSGSVSVTGRIAPLIEVGAGFVPDFTGRENVYLNGAILGLKKTEIDRKLDQIVSFAELTEFIDTPVKRYSSGMQVKLAFSVATSVESEVLIVDEVLAVGDLAFQRKCFDRMEELIKKEGRTVLLVSHNIRQVERMCSRTILMNHGRVVMDGPSKDVCNAFYEYSDRQIYDRRLTSAGNKLSSGDVDLIAASIHDSTGQEISTIQYLSDIEVKVEFRAHKSVPRPIFGIGFHTTDFLYLATRQSLGELEVSELTPGDYTIRFHIKKFPFMPGVYSLRLGVALSETFQPVFYQENVLPILVSTDKINRAVASNGSSEGFVELFGNWSISNLSKESSPPSENELPLTVELQDAQNAKERPQ